MLEDVCASVAEYMKNQEFAKTPGVHLEGPFINPKCCGAQNPAFVRQPDYDEVANLNSIAKVLLVSLAPEMPGAIEFIEKATANGIRCSAGHSAATHEDFNRAKSAGLAHLTHYCNQMSPCTTVKSAWWDPACWTGKSRLKSSATPSTSARTCSKPCSRTRILTRC